MQQHGAEDHEGSVGVVPTVVTLLFGERSPLVERYVGLLAGAGVERGLLGPGEVPRLWHRHVLNCAVLAELIEPGERVVDVGSGAGLPGIVLALARPDLHVDLVEPLQRRAAFLAEAVELLGVDATVVRGRAEERSVRAAVGEADVVTSRAVAPLGRLVGWCAPLARPGGRLLAMKGVSVTAELERDGATIARAGLSKVRVRECGGGVLEQPSRVVEGVCNVGRKVKRARG